jgi:hypothetical protein
VNPAVLIMVRAPRRGEARRALIPLLGADRAAALQAALIIQTLQWARNVAPDDVHIAHEPADAAAELRHLVGNHTSLFPQNGDGIAGRLANAAARLFVHHDGPLLIAWPDLPRLREDHARAALGDLEAGCEVVLGPAIDGGFYLIGLARPLPQLFGLSEQAWRSPDAMSVGLAAAREAGLEIGLLRAERGLHRPADVRAALADPLLPVEISQILERS